MMSNSWTALEVGKRHPLVRPGQPEGVTFGIGADGLYLLGVIGDPTPKEIRAWARGRLRLGVLPAGQHVAFLLYELDGFAPWSDAPYSLGLSHGRLPQPPRPEGAALMQLTLVDAATAGIKSLRVVSVSAALCAELWRALDGQASALPAYSEAARQAEVDAAYRRWPHSRDMVKAANLIEVAGILPPAT
ncbi:MAG: hypothetical protein J0H82_06400 [Alphaproteobacteria bacterium]|jgi:hypothetical protein|nr:hypothetical protein [Alphaproteobacteria bacterium]